MQTVINKTLTHYLLINPKAKKTAILLHGWGHNSSLWQQAVLEFDPRYRYYLLDLPGFGSTQNLPPGADIPEFTQFVSSFIKKMKIKQPLVIGHSFGGQIAIDLAASYSNLPSAIILIAPAGIRTIDPKLNLKVYLINHLARLYRPIKKAIPFLAHTPLTNNLASADYKAASPANRQVLKKIIRHDLTHKLNQISTPTLIVWPELDQELPNFSRTLTDHIPNSRLRVLYGQDHNPHLNNPSELISTINHFLSTL